MRTLVVTGLGIAALVGAAVAQADEVICEEHSLDALTQLDNTGAERPPDGFWVRSLIAVGGLHAGAYAAMPVANENDEAVWANIRAAICVETLQPDPPPPTPETPASEGGTGGTAWTILVPSGSAPLETAPEDAECHRFFCEGR